MLPLYLTTHAHTVSEQGDTVVNGDASNGETPHKKWDVIVITGKRENCEGAKEALQVGGILWGNITWGMAYKKHII